jgi:4-nitrophenyl phosphatase
MESFKNFAAFIIDMDGVLWHGERPVEGLQAFFLVLREQNKRFILATNNASLTPEQYLKKLDRMGVEIHLNEVLTSAMATACYLAEQVDAKNTRVFVLGEEGARQPLREQGFVLTDLYEVDPDNKADIVVCGKDETITWDKLATATLNIRAGAKFFGTNGDITLPTERGLILGNGAILAALETATGVKPTIIGKPGPILYQQALKILGTNLNDTIAIGDRLDTDILGAVNAGLRSIFVLSGVSNEADLKSVDYMPTWIVRDIRAITQSLRNLET